MTDHYFHSFYIVYTRKSIIKENNDVIILINIYIEKVLV